MPQSINFYDTWEKLPANRTYDNAFKVEWELFIRHLFDGTPFRWNLLEGAKGVQLAELGLKSWTARPRPDGSDTFFHGPAPEGAGAPIDVRDPRNRHLFLLTEGELDVDRLKRGAAVAAPTVSASMATAVLAYSGIAVKMLVDQRLDAQLHTMFMVDYQPGAVAHPHDHPFEESYYMLEGEVDVAAQAPVVPTVVHGAREVMRKGSFWVRSGTVDVHFLEPVSTAGLDYEDRGELMTTVWTAMADTLRELYGATSNERPIAAAGERLE